MSRYLFVHGSGHGAWCWEQVLPHIPNARAIDLPGHGSDRTPPEQITLDSYVDALIDAITAIGAPVTLVAHSAGGMVIAAVADRAPELVARLIFVCAYIPGDGQSLIGLRKRARRQLVLPAVKLDEGGHSYSIRPEIAPSVFYHDCPRAAIDAALPRLCPEPVRPQATPLVTGDNYASTPRHYILCSNDRTIPPEEQEYMVRHWPARDVVRLPSGHSPFYSMPDRLARAILSAGTPP